MISFKWGKLSRRQRIVLKWWASDKYKDKDGIIADGAIRSGKTVSMGFSYVIWAMSNYDRENFGCAGKTIESFRRNVLVNLKKQLRAEGYSVTERKSENLFIVSKGEKANNFYIFGGKDERSQDLIQGITLAGMFFDEVALMPESFVNQATARCSVEGSKYWFNCNPEGPDHWFYKDWIKKARERNLVYLRFTMADNLTLSKAIRERYERMYSGVFYDRFIKGLWVLASGVIFKYFANDDKKYTFEEKELYDDDGHLKQQYSKLVMGIDFGGNLSKTTYVLTGYVDGYKSFDVLEADGLPITEEIGSKEICDKFTQFYSMCLDKYKRVDWIFPDSASPTMINSLRAAAKDAGLPYGKITGCRKNEVRERPRTVDMLFNTGRLRINNRLTELINAIKNLRWDEKHPDIPEDKNIGNCNDWWDAFCYTLLNFIEYIDLRR